MIDSLPRSAAQYYPNDGHDLHPIIVSDPAPQALLQAYLSEGLRRDEAQFAFGPAARLIEVLKKRGVPESVLEEAVREVHPT